MPLGSICAPQCPAGFVNTSIFCPKVPAQLLLPLPLPPAPAPDRLRRQVPAGTTEVALDCLFHQNPLKPTDKGYNKSCPCPGPKTVTNPDGCTCMSGCALEGCPSNAACGGGRVCNMRSAHKRPLLFCPEAERLNGAVRC